MGKCRLTLSAHYGTATIIDAPSSTKNKSKARDPEMSSTKKGNDWYFGMKAHVGVDAASGVVHSLDTITVKVHDSRVWNQLLHGEEASVWADKGYVSAERETAFTGADRCWGVMRKAPKGSKLHHLEEAINRIISMVRAKVEHPFRVVKRQFGYVKTRFRRSRQEPCSALHAVRPRQPVSGSTTADGMRRSLRENRHTAPPATLASRHPAARRRNATGRAIRPPSRRSRTR